MLVKGAPDVPAPDGADCKIKQLFFQLSLAIIDFQKGFDDQGTKCLMGTMNKPARRQAIIWSNYGLFHWHIYASLGLNE